MDFAWISVACGNGSAPGPIKVGLHVMVCDVYLGLSREGVGDLGRNWLDAVRRIGRRTSQRSSNHGREAGRSIRGKTESREVDAIDGV